MKNKIGKNYIEQLTNKEKFTSPERVINSWNNSFIFKHSKDNNDKGLRTPQIGALFAIKAHWTTSYKPVTIVMPTGTGKTETMLAAIVSEECKKTLIIAPSNLLRSQIYNKCLTLGILKDIDVVKKKAIQPIVALIQSTPKSNEEMDKLISANIIVTTMHMLNKLPSGYINKLRESCDTLIVDEAHHIAAKTWYKMKRQFSNIKILQFTATPFRFDNKKIDGDIIYNFPLKLAQEQGYFSEINFNEIIEYDDEKSDTAIAYAAIMQLKTDLENGYNHMLLVRAKTVDRAEELFNNIYAKKYSCYKPVLITNKTKVKDKKIYFECINDGISKIVVCVDMFGEGIDIPELKIAAIHDKYKSLPITLQFVGRFARARSGLGSATIIANIANEDINEGLKELYSQDSDWNELLVRKSDKAIGKEIDIQKFVQGFDLANINVGSLVPKVSTVMYRVDDENWNYESWESALNPDNSLCTVNTEKKVMIIIEKSESTIKWSLEKDFCNTNYQLHLIYLDVRRKIVHINTTEKSKRTSLVETMFTNPKIINGEDIFKCLHGVNHLMLGTVGLLTAYNGPIRYKMFAGIDIADAITESSRANNTKSNLFGNGYSGNGKTSIGCSYKGTIWSHWVESVDYWVNWCNEVCNKVLNNNINVDEIFSGTLVPVEIKARPKATPILITWGSEMYIFNKTRAVIKSNYASADFYDCEFKLLTQNETDDIIFTLSSTDFTEKYKLTFDGDKPDFELVESANLSICYSSKEEKLIDYFKDNPPRITFDDQSTLEKDLYVQYKNSDRIKVDNKDIEKWNWDGVDICKESQYDHSLKKIRRDSIQYHVIQRLIEQNQYTVIFDDDSSGEIADIVAIQEKEDEVVIELFHCKYSSEKNIGSRIADFYEVCGQAQKSVHYKQDIISILDRLRKRENKRLKDSDVSRFQIGSYKKLDILKNMLKFKKVKMNIYIVQPGLDSSKISEDIHDLLSCTKTYCMETYGVKIKIISS